MDTTQLLLTVVLSVTTILLVIVGIQLIFVLKELRITIKKVNGIISGLEKIGLSVEHGFGEMTGFITGFKTIFKMVDILHSKKNGKSK
jgi:hypothetical protein